MLVVRRHEFAEFLIPHKTRKTEHFSLRASTQHNTVQVMDELSRLFCCCDPLTWIITPVSIRHVFSLEFK